MNKPAPAEECAARLRAAAADRTAIEPLSEEFAEMDVAAGYAVQRLLRDAAAPLAGWKLGLTSRAKQAQIGLDEPIYGFLAESDALRPGGHLDTEELIQPRCEPETVFMVGDDLYGLDVTTDDLLAACPQVAVGIEVLNSPYSDYRFTIGDVVADNTSAGRYLVGPPVPFAGVDLRVVGVVVEKNGACVDTAPGAAALGHPAAAVAWLARTLANTDQGLRAGQVVLSGGLTAAVPVRPGDVVAASVDRLGTVRLNCHQGEHATYPGHPGQGTYP